MFRTELICNCFEIGFEDNAPPSLLQFQLYKTADWRYQTSFAFLCSLNMAKVIITGGTGMIGTALTRALVKRGDQVIILTRDASKQQPADNIQFANWNPEAGTLDEKIFQLADYVVHLAGANVAEKRWTDKRKREIVNSRVKSGHLIVKALTEVPNTVKAVISSSAIGYYGPDPVVPDPDSFKETDQPASDFLGTVVQEWEAAISPVTRQNKRLVIFRTGIVLSNEGGAYAEFKRPLKFGLATVLGNGRQMISWIHINDLVRLYLEAIDNDQWKGVYNAVAPQPVNNKDLIKGIAKKQKLHLAVPVPSIALKLALGEMSVEVLKSTTVSAGKILAQGFHFSYPDIKSAIQQLEAS
jgi:uncharacterized protein